MNIITKEKSTIIKNRIAYEILKENKPYDKAIEEGRKNLLEEIMK
jgi:energy-converting hydrogenase A subunit M